MGIYLYQEHASKYFLSVSNIFIAREKPKHHLNRWCIVTRVIQPEAEQHNHVNKHGLMHSGKGMCTYMSMKDMYVCLSPHIDVYVCGVGNTAHYPKANLIYPVYQVSDRVSVVFE